MNKFEFNDIEPYLKVNDVIGSGKFSDVYKGKYKEQEIAIKKIDIFLNKDENKINKKSREIRILNDYKFEYITKLFGTVAKYPSIYLILEYMDGGNLSSLVHSKEEYCFKDVMLWFLCAAKALDFLHSACQEIIHRDVKPGNMVLDKSRKTLKLCDLGLSRICKTKMSNKSGTCIYMAPQVFRGNKYGTKADIFSLSVSLAETLVRELPYKELSHLAELTFTEEVYRGKRPNLANAVVSYTTEVKEMIKKGWKHKEEDRPTAKEFVNLLQKQFDNAEECSCRSN